MGATRRLCRAQKRFAGRFSPRSGNPSRSPCLMATTLPCWRTAKRAAANLAPCLGPARSWARAAWARTTSGAWCRGASSLCSTKLTANCGAATAQCNTRAAAAFLRPSTSVCLTPSTRRAAAATAARVRAAAAKAGYQEAVHLCLLLEGKTLLQKHLFPIAECLAVATAVAMDFLLALLALFLLLAHHRQCRPSLAGQAQRRRRAVSDKSL